MTKPKKTKRKGRSDDDSFNSSPVPESHDVVRDRSNSKRRKTIEEKQQHKITQYTQRSDMEGFLSDEDGRQREGTHGSSAVPTNVILDKLDALNEIIKDGKENYRRMDQKIERILGDCFEIRKENVMFKKQIESLNKDVEAMSEEIERLQKKLKEEKELRNNLEQYTRKDNIKIINLQGDKNRETAEETETVVINFLHSQLGLTSITKDHISIAHRVGPFRHSQNRSVIVKFIARKTKVLVMKNRKLLKNKSEVFINEDLTKLNSQRLAELKKHAGVQSAWTFEGTLYCRLDNQEVTKVENGDLSLIDRILTHTPSTQAEQQPMAQYSRPGAGGGRGSQSTFIGKALRGGGRGRGGKQGNRSPAWKDVRPPPSARSSLNVQPPGGERRSQPPETQAVSAEERPEIFSDIATTSPYRAGVGDSQQCPSGKSANPDACKNRDMDSSMDIASQEVKGSQDAASS